MKKLLSLLTAAICAVSLSAGVVEFQFSDGVDSGALKTKMEQNVSKLLTAINAAKAQNTDINFSGIDISDTAVESLASSWNTVHFSTEDDFIVDHCISRKRPSGAVKGFQLRNIGLTMFPLDDSYDSGSRRELVIDFTPAGRIDDINFAMENTEYARMLAEGNTVGEIERRMQILDWCEKFKNAYNTKNLPFMEDIFSDYALIITGKVITERRKGPEYPATSKVVYTQQNKRQYLDGLRRVFKRNSYINVVFDDYRVLQHPAKPDYYYVTLSQKWHTTGYSDEGIVVLVWDFTDEDHPQILVRTWQPYGETPFGPKDIPVL